MIRVLIADDSATAREFLREILSSDPEFAVVGEAHDGEEAVAKVRALRPDLVTMDIHMPGTDGLAATMRIMTEMPTPVVMVSRSVEAGDVAFALNALNLGALHVLAPPPGPGSPDFEAEVHDFLAMLKAMSQVKLVRRWAPEEEKPPIRPIGERVVAIAASTGGPAAVKQVLSDLPGDFPCPILVVQHIARGFSEGLAQWLQTHVPQRVILAAKGLAAEPRTVYVAPDDRHLGLAEDGKLVVADSLPIEGFRPSATFLFESVARTRGCGAIGVILTGMGTDGLEGLRVLHAAGGHVIAQDEATSVVFGMSGAAIAAGLADVTAPVERIGAEVMRALALPERRAPDVRGRERPW